MAIMYFQRLQLVCGVLALTLIHSTQAQATATVTENGIVSAAGDPQVTQSVSYSIIGGGDVIAGTGIGVLTESLTAAATPTTTGTTIMSGTDSNISNGSDHTLTIPAILGITVAVVLVIVGSLIFAIVMHKRRRQATSRARRRTIMDAEFAASLSNLQHIDTEKSTNIGYFDLAKPLPAVTEKEMPYRPERPLEDDRLSRSSTIIATDAAEIAQINRKASSHQSKHKKSREQQRERNYALQILVANEDNRPNVLHYSPHSPLASNPTTPVDAEPTTPWGECLDSNGDAFAKRPSKT